MNKPEYLTFEEYKDKVTAMEGTHWSPHTIASRWDYHARTVELVKSLNLPDASKILEMGTMGIQCVKNSKTIDYAEQWDFPGKEPDYLHDARQIPWPIEDKEYDLFIALRVFQHLTPKQEECFKEAVRIAKKIIIVVDENYNVPQHPESKGIKYNDFVKYLKGVHPNVFVMTSSMGNLYYWDLENPSYLDLSGVMKKFSNPFGNPKLSIPQRIKRRIKKLIS